jgi:hypothetical protein
MSKDLETMRKDGKLGFVERPYREAFDGEIEFLGDFDLVNCRGLNISEEGIAFQMDEPMTFKMRFKRDGKSYDQQAKLVWAQPLDNRKGYQMGFEFEGGKGGFEPELED